MLVWKIVLIYKIYQLYSEVNVEITLCRIIFHSRMQKFSNLFVDGVPKSVENSESEAKDLLNEIGRMIVPTESPSV